MYVGGCAHTDTSPQLPGGCAVSMRSVAYKSGKKDKPEECPPSHWHWCTLCWAPGSRSVTAATAPALSLAPSSDQHSQSAGKTPKPPYLSPRERSIWLDKIIQSQHHLFDSSPAVSNLPATSSHMSLPFIVVSLVTTKQTKKVFIQPLAPENLLCSFLWMICCQIVCWLTQNCMILASFLWHDHPINTLIYYIQR